jgi:hypothetical protein
VIGDLVMCYQRIDGSNVGLVHNVSVELWSLPAPNETLKT